MEARPEICSYWFGPRLRAIDVICLKSMVRTGHRVKLFTYEPVANVPAGVEVHDGERILPVMTLRRLDPDFPKSRNIISILHFSDFFRIALMRKGEGVWLDSDVFMFRKFDPPRDRLFLARESAERLGVSAMYLPMDSPVIREFDEFTASADLVPNWLGFRRRVLRPLFYRLTGRKFTTAKAGVTIFANDGITRLAKRHGFIGQAAPRRTFYALTGNEVSQIYDPAFDYRGLFAPDIYGLHVLRKGGAQQAPRPGSFYAWAWDQVGGA